jgi:hypothetical protein
MIDVSEAVVSELSQTFTVLRSTGAFVNGVWKTQQTQLQFQGVITVAADHELEMIPEADVVHGAKSFYTDQQILMTQEAPAPPTSGTGYSSDILVELETGIQYRVLRVSRHPGSGFWRAVATRMSTGA